MKSLFMYNLVRAPVVLLIRAPLVVIFNLLIFIGESSQIIGSRLMRKLPTFKTKREHDRTNNS